MCTSCPFHDAGWTELRGLLELRALSEASPICHSTGSTALVSKKKRTSSRQEVCRGARNLQLQFFHGIGFIEEATDEAWDAKFEEVTRAADNKRQKR